MWPSPRAPVPPCARYADGRVFPLPKPASWPELLATSKLSFTGLSQEAKVALRATRFGAMNDRGAVPHVQVEAMRGLCRVALRAHRDSDPELLDDVLEVIRHLVRSGTWVDDGTTPKLAEVLGPPLGLDWHDDLSGWAHLQATPAQPPPADAPTGNTCGIM